MSILDTAKDIYDLARKGATIDLQERLVHLREEAVSLQEENLALKETIKSLEASLNIEGEIDFDGSVYWRTDQSSGARAGPYCQRCYDIDQQLVRLQSHHYKWEHEDHYSWQCRACEKSFEVNRR